MFYRNIKPKDKQIESEFQYELKVVKKSFENEKDSQPKANRITWDDISKCRVFCNSKSLKFLLM